MKKFSKILVLALVFVLLFGTVSVFASEPYDTYTYSIDGVPLMSPDAYRTQQVVDSTDMKIKNVSSLVSLSHSANDVVSDTDGNVYIADTGNNRIVILDKRYKAQAVISEFVDEYGSHQKFSGPQGIFVQTTVDDETNEVARNLYVCDTGNRRIVVFKQTETGEFAHLRTLDKPVTPVLEDAAFEPASIAVDLYGRIFVVSPKCFEGVIVMSSEGDFTGFIGVQKVTYTLLDMIWRRFQSSEERASEVRKLADPYNNITVDEEGFVYVTLNPTDKASQYAAIKSKSAASSPVKKLNSAGNEIMKRNGFFDPSGEVAILGGEGVSKITDVAVGEEGAWTIIDQSRSRTFTYDQNGNLLFAFGDMGEQLGSIAKGKALSITYQKIKDYERSEQEGVVRYDYLLLILYQDGTVSRLAVYEPTQYYDTIISALRNQNEHNYSESIFFWQDVLKRNNNFDLAYIGIGKALFSQGKYEEAQLMLESAYETEMHDKAFMEIRKAIIQKYLLPLLIAVIALIVLVLKFLGYAKKKNKATSLKARVLLSCCIQKMHLFQ